jgi:hypothetical protein
VSSLLNESPNLRAALLLSIQRALLGEVTPNIRAVTCRIDPDRIVLRWIVDGAISNELKGDLGAIGTEVVADFSTHQISEEFVRCDAPADIRSYYLDDIAYLRKG